MSGSARMDEQEDWLVMDGRAWDSIADASVLVACGQERPSVRSLRRDWGQQGAVLVRCFDWDGKAYCSSEIVARIP